MRFDQPLQRGYGTAPKDIGREGEDLSRQFCDSIACGADGRRGASEVHDEGQSASTWFTWDGRKMSLEDQALGPMKTPEEMKTDFSAASHLLRSIDGYVALFNQAFPGEAIGEETIAKAIGAFERTVVSEDSHFDRWLT